MEAKPSSKKALVVLLVLIIVVLVVGILGYFAYTLILKKQPSQSTVDVRINVVDPTGIEVKEVESLELWVKGEGFEKFGKSLGVEERELSIAVPSGFNREFEASAKVAGKLYSATKTVDLEPNTRVVVEIKIEVTELGEVAEETTVPEETVPSGETSAVSTTTETTSPTETTATQVPTIRLEIYEGPTYSPADNICYHKIRAIVTGNPAPDISFSKDDSGGAWGSDKVQINLHEGESYTLIAVAKNSAGTASDSMLLTWGCGETTETTEPAFAVIGVTASVDPPSYTGVCPAEFIWSAVITVNSPGTVTYQWEVGGGSPDPPQSITFSSAGSQTVNRHYSISAGWPDTTGWRRVRILSPNEMVSNQAEFTLTCYPDIEVMPTTVNLGEIACGSSTTYGVIIKNTSIGKLDISSANITLGGSFFSIADDSCTGHSLFHNQECTISIKFGPLSVCGPAGTRYSGNLRIRSNDPDEGTVNVTLNATQR